MSVSQLQYALTSLMKRFRSCFNDHPSFSLSNMIIICKLIVLIGLLITFFSDHWAISSISSHIFAGYKKRCSVHSCAPNYVDPVWLIDIACCLALINFTFELINISLIYCRVAKASNIKTAIEILTLFSTFILTNCLIMFGICILIYAGALSMGYAFSCFIVSICFSILDWACLLRRLVNNWPDSEVLLYNHSATQVVDIDRFMAEPRQCTVSSSNSTTMNCTYV